MSLPLVSVIIRTVNRIDMLENAIQSVIAQHHRWIQLVLINDGEALEQTEALAHFAQQHLQEVVYRHNTGTHGRSYAANLGLDNATGDYVIFLDEDDWIAPEHISKLLQALSENTRFSVAYTGIALLNEKGEAVKNMEDIWEPARLRVVNYLPIHAVIFKRTIVDGCRFDTSIELMEDWDFWLQLASKNDFYYVSGISGVYNITRGQSGLSDNRDVAKVQKSHARILQKWLPRFAETDLSESVLWLDTAMDFYRQQATEFEIQLKQAQETDLHYQDVLKSKADLQKKHDILDAEYQVLRSEHQALRSEHQALRNEYHVIISENNHLKAFVDSLLGSKSWKATQPLRTAMKWAKLGKYAINNPGLVKRAIDEIRILGFQKTLTKINNKFYKIEQHAVAGDKTAQYQKSDLVGMLLKTAPSFALVAQEPIDIILPVYNGKEYLSPLLESLINNTNLPYRLLVCDDKSSDPDVFPLLVSIKQKNPMVDFTLIQNETNLGFIKTVNRLSALTKNHFVLLNTDTEVPPDWLQRLMSPIFEMDNIASTTPFTNAGTICSFPRYLEDNPIFENLDVATVDKAFQYVNFDATVIDIPTGVGFCMGINKNVVNEIGMFDEIFGRGYGEENDWCQRALQKGYRHLHVTNLFVYHKHGGSFSSEEKQKLISKNLLTLNQKHPMYDAHVQQLIAKNELNTLRQLVEFLLSCTHSYTTLIFDHNLGGGAHDYVNDEIAKKIALSQTVCLVRYDFNNTHKYNLELIHTTRTIHTTLESMDVVLELLGSIKFDEIFVNSLVSYPAVYQTINTILSIHQRTGARLIVPIHDFFPLCPSYTLMDDTMTYCGVPQDLDRCNACLSKAKGEFKIYQKESNLTQWRKEWEKLLGHCDAIVCFSHSSQEIFARAYPSNSDKTHVIPHDISGRYSPIYTPSNPSNEIRIGILGGINEAKGANVIKDLVDHIDTHHLNAKVILIGQISLPIASPCFEATGRYDKNKLPEILKSKNITQFLIPSVWPETFSYTTDEIMQMGYPLIVFNIGAPAERVKNYPLGKVIEIEDLYGVLFGD